MSGMSDRELLELIAAQVGKLTAKVDGISNEFSLFKSEADDRLKRIDNRLIVIENDHGSRLGALLDGYKQLAEVQEEIKSDVHNIKAKQDREELAKQFVKNLK